MLTDDDVRYVRAEFVSLDEACVRAERDPNEVRALIAKRELPAPPYVLPDGTEFVPDGYFDLPDAAAYGAEADAYLDGGYFVCLRHATPENVVRKEELVAELRALIAEPLPADPSWRAILRLRVDELDDLERAFSPDHDRSRFGAPPTRDELIAEPRRRWPQLWR